MAAKKKVFRLKGTDKTFTLKPKAPKFKPRDRTKKPGGSNKYV